MFADAMNVAFDIGNPKAMLLAAQGMGELAAMQAKLDSKQWYSDILGGVEKASASLWESTAEAAGFPTDVNLDWTRERLAAERAARQHAIDDKRREIEMKINASNEEHLKQQAADQAALEAERLKTEEAAKRSALERRANEARRALMRQLNGFATGGSFSGFLAKAIGSFVQTRGVDQQQLEALKSIEDTIDEVAVNTQGLRDITGLTFTGEA